MYAPAGAYASAVRMFRLMGAHRVRKGMQCAVRRLSFIELRLRVDRVTSICELFL